MSGPEALKKKRKSESVDDIVQEAEKEIEKIGVSIPILQDVCICLTGLPASKKTELHNLVEALGGRYRRDLVTQKTTHLIAYLTYYLLKKQKIDKHFFGCQAQRDILDIHRDDERQVLIENHIMEVTVGRTRKRSREKFRKTAFSASQLITKRNLQGIIDKSKSCITAPVNRMEEIFAGYLDIFCNSPY